MNKQLFSLGFFLFLILPAAGLLNNMQAMDVVDGFPTVIDNCDPAGSIIHGSDGRTVDIVGGTSFSGSSTGRAKGNAYRVDMDITLTEAEFWLDFSDSQILTYYVFVCPSEFGTYSEVYRNSEIVVGTGAGWYSSGTVSIDLNTDNYYINIVSWDGNMTYYYNTGDSLSTSFGAYVHGYASGYDPLPASFESTNNDQAIYCQRLNTIENTALDMTTWGAIKAVHTD
ncbi:MAG: hypothetical protein K8S15_12250 [Candidatus Aegiribacteria sp.]|nr:hypothetical protein [Candidatus Aegiribacteria sp.]